MNAAPRPRPSLDSANTPFWASVRRHRLELPRCAACRSFHWPARDRCPNCLATELEWVPVAGTGTLYSYAVFHQLYHPAFEGSLPYNVAIVELDEGPRLVSKVRAPNERLRIGARMRIEYEDLDGETALHCFVPAGD